MTTGILAGKLAIITGALFGDQGAGSGIGRAVCSLFAREGAKVIAADQNVKAAEDTVAMLKGVQGHIPIKVDVTDSRSIENAFNKARESFSIPPSLVVNSAGITRDNFILKLSEIDFDEVIKVNLKGTFLVTQCAANSMINSGVTGGSIVNVASIIGKYGNIGQSNYAASKAGVEALTKSAAMEFGQFDIRINAVLPGFIETPMTDTVPEKVKNLFLKRISLKRMGLPNEVAELILFLTSPKSSYIHGTSIEITGGMH